MRSLIAFIGNRLLQQNRPLAEMLPPMSAIGPYATWQGKRTKTALIPEADTGGASRTMPIYEFTPSCPSIAHVIVFAVTVMPTAAFVSSPAAIVPLRV